MSSHPDDTKVSTHERRKERKKVSASFPHSKMALRGSTTGNSHETKEKRMKKEKLERDEEKENFHVASSQLILSLSCSESGFHVSMSDIEFKS